MKHLLCVFVFLLISGSAHAGDPCQQPATLDCILRQYLHIGTSDEPGWQNILNDRKRLPRHRVRVKTPDKLTAADAKRRNKIVDHGSLSGFPAPLVEKVGEIERNCSGFHVISSYRPHAHVRGSGRLSLHAVKRAIDITGRNYRCAYAHLRGFPGGYSLDPYAVHHIHLSWNPGGSEWRARFYHYGHGPRRYAHRHHQFAIHGRHRVG